MNKKQNGFKQWSDLKTFQKVIFVAGGLVLFSVVGSIVDEEPQTPDEEQVVKSEDKKEPKSDNVKKEKEPAEKTEPVKEVKKTKSNDTSDEYYTQEEYFENLTSYFLLLSNVGMSLESFGDELSITGEVTPEAEQYIQDAIDELEIGAYLISDEGMDLKVPKHIKQLHQDVIKVHEMYEAGLLEIQEGAKTEDVDVMMSGIEKVEEANLLHNNINVQLEEME